MIIFFNKCNEPWNPREDPRLCSRIRVCSGIDLKFGDWKRDSDRQPRCDLTLIPTLSKVLSPDIT